MLWSMTTSRHTSATLPWRPSPSKASSSVGSSMALLAMKRLLHRGFLQVDTHYRSLCLPPPLIATLCHTPTTNLLQHPLCYTTSIFKTNLQSHPLCYTRRAMSCLPHPLHHTPSSTPAYTPPLRNPPFARPPSPDASTTPFTTLLPTMLLPSALFFCTT